MLNPFKTLGDMNAMRKQASAIQSALEQLEFEAQSGRVKVIISGNQSVKRVEIDGEENVDVRHAINDAIKKSQQAAASQLMELSKNMQ